MQCPKCDYEPTMAEMQRSPDECPKCGIIYAKMRKEPGREAPPPLHDAPAQEASKRSGASRYVIWLVVLVLIGGAAFGGIKGYQHYERQRFVESAESYVRGTTVHLEQIIETQKNPGGITFQEMFNKAAKSVEEVDGFIVQVSMLNGQQDIKDAAVAYMKSVQEVIRGISGSSRALLKMSTSMDSVDRARDRYIASDNEYSTKYAKEAWDESIKDSTEAMKKVGEAKESLNASLAKARIAADKLIWFAPESKPKEDLLKKI